MHIEHHEARCSYTIRFFQMFFFFSLEMYCRLIGGILDNKEKYKGNA